MVFLSVNILKIAILMLGMIISTFISSNGSETNSYGILCLFSAKYQDYYGNFLNVFKISFKSNGNRKSSAYIYSIENICRQKWSSTLAKYHISDPDLEILSVYDFAKPLSAP